MLKIDIKDKELLKNLDAYCYIMDINTDSYIIDAIKTQLLKDISIIKSNLSDIGITTKDIYKLSNNKGYKNNG